MTDLATPHVARREMGAAVVVVEAGSAARAEALLRLAGWTSVDAPPPAPWCLGGQGMALVRTVGDPGAAADVVEARARGMAVVAAATDAALRGRLVADLERLGPVVQPDETRPAADPVTLLDPGQLGLLVALGNGASVRAAARQVNVSVRTAYRRIEAARATLGDVPLGTAVGRVLAAQAGLRWVSSAWTQATPLVGRADELACVVEAVRDGRSVRVCGPPGSGVSSLLRVAAAEVDRPVAVAAGLDLCRDRSRAAVAALTGRIPTARDAAAAAREVATALAGQVVLVDDAQWLDPDSAAVLDELADHMPVVLGVVAGAQAGPTMREGTSGREPAVAVALGPLDPAAAAALAQTVDGLPDAAVGTVVRGAGGWPGPLLAAARRAAAADDIDTRAAAAVGHLSPAARRTIARAVAAGGRVPARDVTPLVALELGDLPFPCLADGGEVVLGPTILVAVRAALSQEEISRAHCHVAEQTSDPSEAALHWMAAGEPARARRLALAELASTPGPVVEEQDRTADLLAVVARTAGSRDRARAAADAAAALAVAGRTADAARLVEDVTATDSSLLTAPCLVAVRASLLLNQGIVREALEVVDTALEARDLTSTDEVALRSVRAAAHALSGNDPQGVIDEADRAAAARPDRDFQARMLRGAGMALSGDPTWPEVLLPGLEECLATGSDLEIALLTEIVAQASVLYGDPGRAEQVLARGIGLLPRGSEARHALQVHRAVDAVIAHGPSDDALDRARRVLESIPPGRLHRASWGMVAIGLGDRGRFAEAEDALTRSEASPVEPNGDRVLPWARAEVLLAAGRPDEALVLAEEAAAGPPTHFPAQAASAALVRWAVLDGAAPTVVDRPVSMFPLLQPLTAEADGLEALVAGDPGAAVEHLRRSIADGGMLRNQRRNRWALAEALRRDGRTAEAQHVLEDLAAEAGGADLRPLLARAKATLRRMGASGGRRTGRHPSGLTEREVEVLLLVADGLSTPDIAARLHIARSTVDTLVRSARQKLGARTRREAAAVVVAQLDDAGRASGARRDA
jgi:DNA-binding NarL/FixJ family response regulator